MSNAPYSKNLQPDLQPLKSSDSSLGKLAIDLNAHRNVRNYRVGIYVSRVLWNIVYPLFRFSPRLLYGWRNMLLRLFGAKIGKRVRVYPSATIVFPWNLEIGNYSTIAWDCTVYCLGNVSIGDNSMISQGTHICAGSHDYRQQHLPLLTSPIQIGNGVWCCADSFIGPGIVVHDNAVIAARAVVVGDVDPGVVVAGNPARVVAKR